jgi:hypothetical protein
MLSVSDTSPIFSRSSSSAVAISCERAGRAVELPDDQRVAGAQHVF